MSKITIWSRKLSLNVQSVLWCLGELNLTFDLIDSGVAYGVVATADFLAMKPNGKLPVLVDADGWRIFESGAIFRYLATLWGAGPLWRDGLAARAALDKWAELVKLNFANQFILPGYWPLVRSPPSQRDYLVGTGALGLVEKELSIVDKAPASDAFLAGQEFSLADIQFGRCPHRYFDSDLERADLPHLRARYERLQARSVFTRNLVVSYND